MQLYVYRWQSQTCVTHISFVEESFRKNNVVFDTWIEGKKGRFFRPGVSIGNVNWLWNMGIFDMYFPHCVLFQNVGNLDFDIPMVDNFHLTLQIVEDLTLLLNQCRHFKYHIGKILKSCLILWNIYIALFTDQRPCNRMQNTLLISRSTKPHGKRGDKQDLVFSVKLQFK